MDCSPIDEIALMCNVQLQSIVIIVIIIVIVLVNSSRD